jgi:two-component system LytT family response regulator
MALRVVVVDDEPIARRRLRRLLASIANVAIVGEAGDGHRALACIDETQPDLVLLDVQMPECDGLTVSRRLRPPRPLVVFVTAFDKFAVEAFDVQAVDYLLKPVSDVRLGAAIDRVRRRLATTSPQHASRGVSRMAEVGPRRWLDRLPIRSEGCVELVAVADIDWLEAADNYVVVHAGRKNHVLRDTLTRLERDLDPAVFVRIHRSTIVRVDRIVRLDVAMRGDYDVRLRDGTALVLSRTCRTRVERALGRRL